MLDDPKQLIWQSISDVIKRLATDCSLHPEAVADVAFLHIQKHPSGGRNATKAQKKASHQHWQGRWSPLPRTACRPSQGHQDHGHRTASGLGKRSYGLEDCRTIRDIGFCRFDESLGPAKRDLGVKRFVTRQDLARQVAYLKEENRILRARLPKQLVASDQEKRRLLKVAQKLGTQLNELMSFVTYQTFLRWIRERTAAANKPILAPAQKPGRPRIDIEIRGIVLNLVQENSWGNIHLRPHSLRNFRTSRPDVNRRRSLRTRSG